MRQLGSTCRVVGRQTLGLHQVPEQLLAILTANMLAPAGNGQLVLLQHQCDPRLPLEIGPVRVLAERLEVDPVEDLQPVQQG